MDTQQFLKAFGHVANARGGIAKLRELILALAVQGKLVIQNPAEEPATAQLSRIKTKALECPSSGRRKKSSDGEPLTDSALAENLPTGWVRARLSDLTQVLNGRAYSKSELLESGTPVLRVGNLFTSNHWYYSDLQLEEQKYCDRGDLLYAWSASFGPFIWQGDRVIYHYHIWKLALFSEADLDKEFLFTWLSEKTQEIKAAGHGISMAHMTKEKFEQLVIGLPPLAEQIRIVAKVNELMALCDKLEAQQQARRKLQNNLRQAALQTVASATSAYDLQTAWTSLSANFGWLFHAPEDVDDFIAHLKNLAVRGLLEKTSTGSPEIDAIKTSCNALRANYIKSGLMRRQKIIAAAETDVIYPDHWAVAPFDEVAIVIGGVTKGRNLQGRETLTCPYLAVANVQRGFFKLDGLKQIEIAVEEFEKYVVHEGDLLITEGGDWDKVGRTALWRSGVPACLHQNHVFKARVPSELLMNEWVELAFNSGVGRDYFASASKQTTNLASINMTQLRGFPLPIPPLEEQRNLLKKLHSLTASALSWRQKLQIKQNMATALAGAAVSNFTGITAVQTEHTMKAPQTELIALLSLGQVPDIKAQAPLATILARHHGQMPAKDLWQRFGGEIDAFYAQLKTEVAHGWILEPAVAEVREVQTTTTEA